MALGLLDLPDQVIMGIMKQLDPLSLCWTSRANRHLFCLAGGKHFSLQHLPKSLCGVIACFFPAVSSLRPGAGTRKGKQQCPPCAGA